MVIYHHVITSMRFVTHSLRWDKCRYSGLGQCKNVSKAQQLKYTIALELNYCSQQEVEVALHCNITNPILSNIKYKTTT